MPLNPPAPRPVRVTPRVPTLTGGLTITLAACLLAGGAALAETPSEAPHAAPDLRALRFYAREGDLTRLRAESERLATLHPGWTPPADPLVMPDDGTQAFWDLLGEGRTAELRAALAERAADEPHFRPPAELLDRLGAREARARALNARAHGQWRTVLTSADQAGSAGDDIELLWAIAEARFGLDETLEGRQVLLTAWREAGDESVRRGTLTRALDLGGSTLATSLLDEARPAPSPGLRREMDATLARRALGDALDGKVVPPGIAPRVARFIERTRTRAPREASARGDAALLGWVRLVEDAPAEAATWFRLALPEGVPSNASPEAIKATEGLILALARSGEAEAATAFARGAEAWSPALGEIHLGFALERLAAADPGTLSFDTLTHLAGIIAARMSAPGAEALGWYAYRDKAYAPAEAWFRKALDWAGGDREDQIEAVPNAPLGLALAQRALGDLEGFRLTRTTYGDALPELAALETRAPAVRAAPSLRARIAAAQRAGDSGTCLRLSDRLSDRPGGRTAKDAEIRGWCLMEAGRTTEAARAFETALARPDVDAAAAGRGLAWAHLRRGATREAARIAPNLSLDVETRRGVETEIWTQRARAAVNEGRYDDALAALDARDRLAPASRGLTLMRGWALYHEGRRSEALGLFQALDRQLSTPESRRAVAQARRRQP